MTDATKKLLLDSIELSAKHQLEKRVEKYLKDQFNHRILPKILDDIRKNLMVDLIEKDDEIDIVIKMKKEKQD